MKNKIGLAACVLLAGILVAITAFAAVDNSPGNLLARIAQLERRLALIEASSWVTTARLAADNVTVDKIGPYLDATLTSANWTNLYVTNGVVCGKD